MLPELIKYYLYKNNIFKVLLQSHKIYLKYISIGGKNSFVQLHETSRIFDL